MAQPRDRKPQAPPDPARAAIRERIADDRRRREAEFSARGNEWSDQADIWFAAWSRDAEQQEHAERRVRLEAEREVRDRAERKAKRAAQRVAREAYRQLEADEAESRANIDRQRSEQLDRDVAYAAFLLDLGYDWLARIAASNHRWLRRDPLDGVGSRKRFHAHIQPPPPPPPPPPRTTIFEPPPPYPFGVLGVVPKSTKDKIKRAYFRLAKQHHPDRGGDAAEFRRVNEAYALCLKKVGAAR